jgi:transposase InsO family protein
MDNVFIERLWRSLKYECVYLHAFQDGLQARQAIDAWLRYYNEERPHSFLTGDRTPMKELVTVHRISRQAGSKVGVAVW